MVIKPGEGIYRLKWSTYLQDATECHQLSENAEPDYRLMKCAAP